MLLRGHVALGRWPVGRDHGSGFATRSGPHSVVRVRVWTGRWHVWVVMVARVLLVLHRRLAVHLVLVLLRMLLVHGRMMLRVVVHVRGSVFAVGRVTGRAGVAGRWHVMTGRIVRVHAGRRAGPALRMWRWPTGCRRRRSAATAGAIAAGRRFRCLFTTHYMRILSTGVSVSTILQITRFVCLWLLLLLLVMMMLMMIAGNTLFDFSLLLRHLPFRPRALSRLSSSCGDSR